MLKMSHISISIPPHHCIKQSPARFQRPQEIIFPLDSPITSRLHQHVPLLRIFDSTAAGEAPAVAEDLQKLLMCEGLEARIHGANAPREHGRELRVEVELVRDTEALEGIRGEDGVWTAISFFGGFGDQVMEGVG